MPEMLRTIYYIFIRIQSRLFFWKKSRTIRIKDINLVVDSNDAGGQSYGSRASHEEYVNPLYSEISNFLTPTLIIDVGANYGYTGLVFNKRFPDARTVLIEASAKLCSFIGSNFEGNDVSNYTVINAACGGGGGEGVISLNPKNSQDNRVEGLRGWKSQAVPTVSLDKLLVDSDDRVFIKIDTQGYEEQVFRGAEHFLSRSAEWIIKTEFAPYWLGQHGTNPITFLSHLAELYDVVELPSQNRLYGDSIERFIQTPIKASNCVEFVNHLESRDVDRRGWCDLLILPKMAEQYSRSI